MHASLVTASATVRLLAASGLMIYPGSLGPSGYVPGFGGFLDRGHTVPSYNNAVRAVLPSPVEFFFNLISKY